MITSNSNICINSTRGGIVLEKFSCYCMMKEGRTKSTEQKMWQIYLTNDQRSQKGSPCFFNFWILMERNSCSLSTIKTISSWISKPCIRLDGQEKRTVATMIQKGFFLHLSCFQVHQIGSIHQGSYGLVTIESMVGELKKQISCQC